MYKEQQLNCANPRIIRHPHAGYHVACNHNITMYGQRRYVRNSDSYYLMPTKYIIHPDIAHVQCDDPDAIDFVDNFYTENLDGEKFPLYMVVPCGHCPLCRGKKAAAWQTRARMEAQSFKRLPYMVTLTYNDDNLPTDGVNKRDVQLFLKRLRKNLKTHNYDNHLRYILCAEYGKHTLRPHYHMMLYTNQDYTPKDTRAIIQDAWSHGFVQVKKTDGKGYGYVLKYMQKPGKVPQGANPTFFLFSKGKGGIGSRYCDTYLAPFIQKYPHNHEFSFMDKFTGKSEKLYLPSYCLNRILPSFYKSVSSPIRREITYRWTKDAEKWSELATKLRCIPHRDTDTTLAPYIQMKKYEKYDPVDIVDKCEKIINDYPRILELEKARNRHICTTPIKNWMSSTEISRLSLMKSKRQSSKAYLEIF